eukprot:CAMPEP_0179105340 /NCGR_PEP_ID=MMETSP0796-20121207/48919_1 /TAXON_ID=73915 /ORGANISM="Pyrodinium bahamense, Strain pbaha01" /LENGTH=38 /DNA_ID= /DNA_START= /DNA_END= /DNA_ORIENTATION=
MTLWRNAFTSVTPGRRSLELRTLTRGSSFGGTGAGSSC